MIETVMIFALGFLAATLLALLTIPAVSARAARLTKRRIDATLPLSIDEIAGEKDHLRAHAAITQRRLERKVEAARASRHADMAVIGARTMEAATLTRAVEARDAEIASVSHKLGGVETDLEAARIEGSIGIATLHALEDAHRALLDDVLSARRERSAERPQALERSSEQSSDDDSSTVDIAAERETLMARLAAAEAALAGRDAEAERADSDLRARISEVAEALTRRERLPSAGALTVPGAVPTHAPAGR